MSDTDTLSRLSALDDERAALLGDLRAERVTLRARLEKLDEILGPEKPKRAKKKVATDEKPKRGGLGRRGLPRAEEKVGA